MRFSREELATFIILACALLAIGALYLLACPSGDYTSSSADGDHVTVTGVLLFKETTHKGGHQVLCLKTDYGSLNVFVPASCDSFAVAKNAVPGKELTVTGRVKSYKNKKEIIADSIIEK
jgi:DNA/RNA endonuclease YhcR with UshA esterase domain